METLPSELIFHILSGQNYNTIMNLSQTSRHFYGIICRNENYWRNKFLRDFGEYHHPVESWKNLYRDTGDIIREDSNGYRLPFKVTQIIDNRTGITVVDVNGNLRILLKNRDSIGQIDNNKISVGPAIMSNVKTTITTYTGYRLVITNNNILYILRYEPVAFDVPAKFLHSSDKTHAIIDLENNIWMSGSNQYGQLGIPYQKYKHDEFIKIDNLKVKYVHCGDKHTAAIDLDDNVWTWGHSYDASLGVDYGLPNIGDTGFEESGVRATPTIRTEIKAKRVFCGHDCIAAIDLEDTLWLTGYNWIFGNDPFRKYLDRFDRYNKFTKIPEIRLRDIIIQEDIILIIDMDNNLHKYTRYSHTIFHSRVMAVNRGSNKYIAITLGYTPTINVNNHEVFFITYRRLSEKLRNLEIRDYNILPELQHYKKNHNNTIVLFRDIYDKLMICEVNYTNDEFLAPYK